jgi:Flp pilus assembly protein TadG
LLVEYSIVFPLLMLVTLAAVDLGYLLWEYSQAARATAVGARLAVVSSPVAQGIDGTTYNDHWGEWCADPATGTDAGLCASVDSVCMVDGCSNGYTMDTTAFRAMVAKMAAVFPRVTADNVTVRYQTSAGPGFVAQIGMPLSVSVSLRDMWHEFYFLPGFSNPRIPASETVMAAESLGQSW